MMVVVFSLSHSPITEKLVTFKRLFAQTASKIYPLQKNGIFGKRFTKKSIFFHPDRLTECVTNDLDKFNLAYWFSFRLELVCTYDKVGPKNVAHFKKN